MILDIRVTKVPCLLLLMMMMLRVQEAVVLNGEYNSRYNLCHGSVQSLGVSPY